MNTPPFPGQSRDSYIAHLNKYIFPRLRKKDLFIPDLHCKENTITLIYGKYHIQSTFLHNFPKFNLSFFSEERQGNSQRYQDSDLEEKTIPLKNKDEPDWDAFYTSNKESLIQYMGTLSQN